MKFKIYYASGIGGDTVDLDEEPQETRDFKNRDQAIDYAWERACEEYEQYAGLHGIRDIDEIMDDDDVGREEAEGIFNEERESSVEYDAVPVVDEKIKKAQNDINKK